MFKMTKSEALRVQAEHVAWYAQRAGVQLKRYAEMLTKEHALPDEGEIDASTINLYLPRGDALVALQPHAVFLSNKLIAYGETRLAADWEFERQISGAPASMRNSMRERAAMVPVDCDLASEIAEMLAASAIRWE